MHTTMTAQYTMPIETNEHEGTWLQWPHNNLYGPYYRDDLRNTWVGMTRELIKGENVHIVAYDENERDYIIETLTDEAVDLTKIDFLIRQNDDCWVRDNGPIFVYDENNNLVVLDWEFNGWGGDTAYDLCNTVPIAISEELALPAIDLNAMVIEGGAFEIDGNGTFLATKSSILGDDRNPNLTQAEAEDYLTTHLGVTNFLWLDGVAGLEITDMHIDGFARFHDTEILVTMNAIDLEYWEVPEADVEILLNASNVNGEAFNFVFLPLTQNNVVTKWGENLGYKGSYVNYYIGNAVVLVPTYDDPRDEDAIALLAELYPNREVVGINVQNLYYSGGMIHCVTQQQPKSLNTVSSTNQAEWTRFELLQNIPNPTSTETIIPFSLQQDANVRLEIFDLKGRLIKTLVNDFLSKGEHNYTFSTSNLTEGMYNYVLTIEGRHSLSKKLIVLK
jgi:agmatine deiminase